MSLRPLVLVSLFALTVCTNERTLPACPPPLPPPRDASAVVAITTGDIADCTTNDHEKVAALVKAERPDLFLALGDLVYPNGSLREFIDCYDPIWSPLRPITRPAAGNHEYHTERAGPYYSYFCSAAGSPKQGYYSFDIGTWHVIALNSNCAKDLDVPPDVLRDFGGCDATSRQAAWLREDLERNRNKCTLAMWHHPKHNLGPHEDATVMHDMWRILVEGGADLALSSHAHQYERFLPEDAAGNVDTANGLVEFVVGTGGAPLNTSPPDKAHSVVRQNTAFGALRLTLLPDRYAWQYLGVETSFTDVGERACRP
jgi:acid phosphatase type 7